jgi:hypothetical protein
LSKSVVESEPSQGADAAKARSTSTFIFLDLFHGVSVSATFRHGVFLVFSSKQIAKTRFSAIARASIACLRQPEASALSVAYTLTVISLALGQFSNKSASELARGCDAGESRVGLKNNKSNSASVSLDEISITSTLGFITIKCGDEAYASLNSHKACARQPKLTKLSEHECIT